MVGCYLIFEAYCCWKWAHKKEIKMFELLEDDSLKPLGIKPNTTYISGKRPVWCRKRADLTPNPECLYDKCPFLALNENEYASLEVELGKKDDKDKEIERLQRRLKLIEAHDK